MEVGVKNLPFAQKTVFFRQRFFDFHDHFRLGKYLLAGNDFGSLLQIILIGDAATLSGQIFQQNFMASGNQVMNACGGHRDPVFISFDFFRNSNDHFRSPDGPVF